MQRYKTNSELKVRRKQIISELNHTVFIIDRIMKRIDEIHLGFVQSGRNSNYYDRFRIELEIAQSDKLYYENSHGDLTMEILEINDILDQN